MTDKMPPSKTIDEHRTEFERLLGDDPVKVSAYRQAMDSVKGDWVNEVLVHLEFKAVHLGLHVNKDKR